MEQYREGQRLKGSDGNVYVVVNGVPTIEAAPSSLPSSIVPPNPVRAARETQERARQSAADARAEAAARRQEEAADRAEREWNATHNPDGSPKPKAAGSGKPLPDGAAKRYEQAIDAFASLDRAVGGFQDDYAGNTLTGGLENTAQSLLGVGTPGQAQWWADFKATDNILRNALFGASLTAGEKAAYEATSIKPSMTPAEVRANLTRRMDLARDTLSRRTNFLKANGYDADAVDALAGEYGDVISGKAKQRAEGEVEDPEVAALAGVKDPGTDRSPTDPENGPTPPDMQVANGANRSDYSARLSAQVNSLINAGAGEATINAILKKENYPSLKPGQYQAARKWMKETGKRFPLGNTIVDRDVPLTMLEKAAASPAAAFVSQAGDAATAGVMGALAGEKGKGALDAMDALHPNASFLGAIGGGVMGAAGAEATLAARAPAALAQYAPRMADAIYGGLSGFNSAQEGDGAMGAALGAGAGVLGGVLGDRAVRAAGSITRGVTNPAVRYLRDRGIPLTTGQTVGDSGFLGRTVKGAEDALTSVPGVGNMIEARRREGIEAFNRAAFQDAAPPGAQINATGAQGMEQVRQSVGNAYRRALDPVTIDANDPDFIADIAAAQAAAARIPDVQPTDPRGFAESALQNRIDGAMQVSSMHGGVLEEFNRDGPDRFVSYRGPDGSRADIHLNIGDDGRAEISIDPFSTSANRFGAGQLRDAMQQIRRLYPEVREVWGERLTGAGPGRTQSINLDNVEPAKISISGRNFQEAYRGLGRSGRERANSDYGHEIGQVMRSGQDALGEALERQNPGAFTDFLEANAANRRAHVLSDALKNAGNQTDELFTPAQLNRADITSTSRLEGKINSASGNRPFYDLTSAGQQVLPSQLGDSGTVKRAIVGALTTGTIGGTGALLGGGEGAGYGTGGGLALSLALGLGGTRTGQRALTSILADRPDLLVDMGNRLHGDFMRRLGSSAAVGTSAALTTRN